MSTPWVAWRGREPRPDHPVVLVLPGGTARSTAAPAKVSLGRIRMWPFTRALVAGLPEAAVGAVHYRVRGWNDDQADPARDVGVLLDRLPVGVGRVALVGHSMGGRAAVAVCHHPVVAGIVGLAAWLTPADPVEPVRGKVVVLAHGSRDRWVTPEHSLQFARRAQDAAGQLARFVVRGDDHSMLRRARHWHRLAVAGVLAGLGQPPRWLAQAFAAGSAGDLEVPLPRLGGVSGR